MNGIQISLLTQKKNENSFTKIITLARKDEKEITTEPR